MSSEKLVEEFEYFLQHQEDLLKQYDGKFLVIKNKSVLGAYDSDVEAIKETVKEHELGTFLVQKCEPGSNSYTRTYHSRVCSK